MDLPALGTQSSGMDILIYLLGLSSLGLSAPLIRLAAVSPEQIGSLRFVGASLLMLPWFVFSAENSGAMKALLKDGKSLKKPLFTALLFFLHLWTFSFSAQNTRIAHCMILFSTNPLFTSLGSWLFYKEKPTKEWLAAYVLAFVGISQLVVHQLNFSFSTALGDLMALLSAVLYAGYVLTGKSVRQKMSTATFTGFVYVVTGFLFASSLFLNPFVQWQPLTSTGWIAIALVILLPTLLGHSLFSYLFKKMNINVMTCGKLIEPTISSAVAFFLFQETVGPQAIFAFLMTAAAILILFFPWKNLKKLR